MTADAMLRLILTSRVYDVARETPLDPAPRLSRRLGNDVLLKREDLQPVFSFKLRGAYNRIAQLSEADRARGVIAASAGNHAQGVAFSARHLGLSALIVMPQTTPEIKVEAVRALGAEVVLSGDSYAEAKARCDELVQRRGLRLRPSLRRSAGDCRPGHDRRSRFCARARTLTAVFVPVGGGGLIAGIAGYIKALQPGRPGHRRRAVRGRRDGPVAGGRPPRRARSMSASSRTASPCARSASTPSRSCRRTVDEIVRVLNDEICAAIKDIFDDTRIDHGAGRRAGARRAEDVGRARPGTRTQRLAAVLSGANMNFDRLRFVAERAELGEAREALFGGHDSRAARARSASSARRSAGAWSPSSTTG